MEKQIERICDFCNIIFDDKGKYKDSFGNHFCRDNCRQMFQYYGGRREDMQAERE